MSSSDKKTDEDDSLCADTSGSMVESQPLIDNASSFLSPPVVPHWYWFPVSSDIHIKIAQREAWLLAELALPTILVLIGCFVPALLTASVVGRHFGTAHLSGLSLAISTTNLSALAIMEGLFSASDTLSPQAYGAGQKLQELGLLAFRGFVVSMVAVFPIAAILVIHMKSILVLLGQDAEAAGYAQEWYRIYICFFPLYALYLALWKFLAAQGVMAPLVASAIISMCILTPAALHWGSNWLGFAGTAFAMVYCQASQVGIVLGYVWLFKPHDPRTWPGLGSFWQALEWKAVTAYVSLGLGGVLALSEWIYWEAVCLVIGTLGVIPLSVHTIPAQVSLVAFMIPNGLGTALSIRIGATLPLNVARAEKIAFGGFVAGVAIISFMSFFLYAKRQLIFAIFTTDEEVLEGCEAIWVHVCATQFFFGLFGINSGILVALGMQWTLGIVNFTSLWFLGLPALYYFAIVRGGGLVVAWNCIWPPYVAMNVALTYVFIRQDWEAVSSEIQRREGIALPKSDELLLALPTDRYGATGQRRVSVEIESQTEVNDG